MKAVKRITRIVFLVLLSSCLACGKTDPITIEEYALEAHSEEPYSSPLQPRSETTLQVSRDVLDKLSGKQSDRCRQTLAHNNELLRSFGYFVDPDSRLVYKGQSLVRDVSWADCSQASINASHDDFVLIVHQADAEGHPKLSAPLVLSRDALKDYARGDSHCSFSHPVYVGNELAFVERCYVSASDIDIQVHIGTQVAYTATVKDVFGNRTMDLWGFDGHWVLEYRQPNPGRSRGHIVWDGQEINQLLGYQESFGFALLNELPFYAYQRDDKSGISYNGQEYSLGYDEIYHYGCCEDGFFNPAYTLKEAFFFARRGSQWYYVEAHVR